MKKNLTEFLSPALLILAMVLAQPALAANETPSSKVENSATSKMDSLRQKFSADKKADKKKQVVASNMNLTEKEAKAFWPVYEAYQKDLSQINARLAKVIDDYALAYKKGVVPNETAKALLDESIDIELSGAKLKQSYVPKFGMALPAAKVARYIQIESKIEAMIRYEIADAIPLVE